MKPEHFLYKSDGLYYMQNVPEEPKYVITDGVNRPHVNYMFDIEYDAYNNALEHSKAEAAKCDNVLQEKAESKISNGKCCVNSNVCQDLGRCMREGKIYTINMEEKIVVVYQYHSSRKYYTDATWIDCTEDQYKSILSFGEVRIIARISAPKNGR